MSTGTAKKIYTPAALEYWLEKLTNDWEKYFSKSELSRGREYYREGMVTELEVNPGHAVVNTKEGRRTYYSIVDWDGDDLEVRCSTDDKDWGRLLAAAGIYELEELLADEISVLPLEEREEVEEDTEEEVKEEEFDAPEETSGYQSVLRFRYRGDGLSFRLIWLDGDRRELSSKEVEQLGSLGREKLVQVTGMAHRSGFKYRKTKGDYLIEDPELAIHFYQKIYPSWKRIFEMEFGPEASLLSRGIQSISISGAASEEDDQNIQLRWRYRVGSKLIGADQALRAYQGNNHIGFVSGVGMVKVDERYRSLIHQWQILSRKDGVFSWPKYILFSLFTEEKIDLEIDESLRSWKDNLLQEAESEEGLPDYLRDYQRKGVRWLKRIFDSECHGLVADEMGLGKTLQVLTLLKSRSIQDLPSIVVCPASVIPVWQSEIAKFYPELKCDVLKSRNDFTHNKEPVLWLSSYTQLRQHKHLLNDVEFAYAILDEAQFIKNPDSKSTHACMALQAKHRIAITGTPIENSEWDIWAIYRFLMPGLLGNRRVFREKMVENEEEGVERLKQQLKPFFLRRTKGKVAIDLPKKVEMDLVCPLTDKQKREYELLTEKGEEELGANLQEVSRKQSTHLFTLLTRLRQVSCDPHLLPWVEADIAQSGKLKVLADKLEEILANGHKVVVFSQFVSLLTRAKKAIQQQFPKAKLYQLTGKTRDRETPVKAFQEEKKPAVMLVSLKAGGTGITLHNADYVFLLDPWWNPAVEEQAIDRVHRIGQKNNVMVYRMYAKGTIEDRVRLLREQKKALFEELVGEVPDLSDFKEHFHSLKELVDLLPGDRLF